MSDETVTTRVDPQTAERLQTVVDAKATSKAQYLRNALKERLKEDHGDLSDEDKILAEVRQMAEESDNSDGQSEKGGLPDPLDLFA